MTEEIKQPLSSHLIELRKRLMGAFIAMAIGTAVCFIFVEQIYGFLVRPLAEAMGEGGTNRLIYTGLTEGFFTYMKSAFLPFLIATPVLFFTGGAVVYYGILPAAWPFFLSFQSDGGATALPIQLEARVSEYLDLIMTLIFAFGLCFQLPVLLTLMGKAGLISARTLKEKRKYIIILAFVVAAFLTPPDVISQVGLALSIFLLYEISIFLVQRLNKNG